MMCFTKLQATLEDIMDQAVTRIDNIPVTVHTGGDSWEQIVDVVFCQECNQYHIISERLPNGHVDPLKGNYY